jgi:uncharacterized phiE125 gp8 family phage protein
VWSLSLITAPSAEPLAVDDGQVKAHLRLDSDLAPQDALLSAAITAARQNCETFTGRQLITATWELWMESWYEEGICREGVLYLPRPPVASITSITYLDSSGVAQTWPADQYTAVFPAGPQASRAQIFPAYGVVWPTALCQPAAIKIRFVAGYGTVGADVPAALRQGMLLELGEMYDRRELSTAGLSSPNVITAERLWWPFRSFS